MHIDMKMPVFFLGKCVRTAAKSKVVDRKKTERTSSATFGVETAAKCCELKQCADRFRNRTDNNDEVLEGKFVTWTFRLPPKRQLRILLNFFFPLIKLFSTFVVFAKTQVTRRFRAKNAGYSTGLSRAPPQIGYPVVRTDVRSHDFYVTTKMSWLDRLPNFLSYGAPLTRYTHGLC